LSKTAVSCRRLQHASSHIDRFDSPVDVRSVFCISWPEKYENSRTSTRFESPVDVRYLFLYLLARKTRKFSHIESSTDSNRQSMCDICFCISWPEKREKFSHIDRFESSRCAISVFVSLGQKITTCIIAHRPIRFTSMSAVCHSSPFCRQSPFRTFRQIFQHVFMVHVFVEMFEMEIVDKRGMSGTRLVDVRYLFL